MGIKNFTYKKKENPYSNLSRDNLLNSYKSDIWSTLGNSEKMQLLQATGNLYANEIGLKSKLLYVQENNKQYYGRYSLNGTISINLELCSNPYQALNTLIHETNHAYQMQCVQDYNGKYSSGERCILKAQVYGYESSGKEYFRQSLEIDSNNAGADYLMKERERFHDDIAYTEYLKERACYFENVIADGRQNKGECMALELYQVERAVTAGKISTAEKEAAVNCIGSEENSIKEQCVSLGEELIHQREMLTMEMALATEKKDSMEQDDGLDEYSSEEYRTSTINMEYNDYNMGY